MNKLTSKHIFGLAFLWVVAVVGLPAQVFAGPVPSSLGNVGSEREDDLAIIEAVLADPEVLEKLEQKGIDPNELRAKLGTMSDHDVHMLAQRLEHAKSGGDALGIIISVLLIVALVYLIIYLVQRT